MQHEAEVTRPDATEIGAKCAGSGEGGGDGGEGDEAVARVGEVSA